jgi:hypothetical protein
MLGNRPVKGLVALIVVQFSSEDLCVMTAREVVSMATKLLSFLLQYSRARQLCPAHNWGNVYMGGTF